MNTVFDLLFAPCKVGCNQKEYKRHDIRVLNVLTPAYPNTIYSRIKRLPTTTLHAITKTKCLLLEGHLLLFLSQNKSSL